MKKLASPRLHDLRRKLAALAERGVNGERDAARLKLSRLERRYDFVTENKGGADIFDGVFVRALEAAPVFTFDAHEYEIANAVKWAIENATKIPCGFRDGSGLIAQAEPKTANRLHAIAGTLCQNFSALWRQYAETPGTNPADKGNFILGLYDGMMHEEREGQALPRRATVDKVKKARKKDVARPAGLAIHPYTIAVGLGRQVRCCMTLDQIAAELEHTIKGEIAA